MKNCMNWQSCTAAMLWFGDKSLWDCCRKWKKGNCMSGRISDRFLNLEKRFESLPALKALLVEGKVSINKLVRVASIATVENEGELAEAVQLLPKKALET